MLRTTETRQDDLENEIHLAIFIIYIFNVYSDKRGKHK